MKQLLYVGKFHPWNDKHEDELFDALETFDEVIICVSKLDRKPLTGQPTKILKSDVRHRIKIVYFNKLSKLLAYKKECKYIMFER